MNLSHLENGAYVIACVAIGLTYFDCLLAIA